MNEDASTYEVPDYILSRLQPTLGMGFPAREDELAILRYHLPFAPAGDARCDGRISSGGPPTESRLSRFAMGSTSCNTP